jgi:hypothetical protein
MKLSHFVIIFIFMSMLTRSQSLQPRRRYRTAYSRQQLDRFPREGAVSLARRWTGFLASIDDREDANWDESSSHDDEWVAAVEDEHEEVFDEGIHTYSDVLKSKPLVDDPSAPPRFKASTANSYEKASLFARLIDEAVVTGRS